MSVAVERAELELLRACDRLGREADEKIERAMRRRTPLRLVIGDLLPLLGQGLDATAAWLRTLDEDLQERDFAWPDAGALGIDPESVVAVTGRREAFVERTGSSTVVGQHLDAAGEVFGCAAVRFDRVLDEAGEERCFRLLDTWCEQLDNYLMAIARARQKHRIGRKLSAALRRPLLHVGIDLALDVLAAEVAFDDLVLVYRHEDDPKGLTLQYKVLRDGKILHDSWTARDARLDESLRESAFLEPGAAGRLADLFGMETACEEVMITGSQRAAVLGRLVVSSREHELSMFDRDLLEVFADFLRMRLVDFNREWRQLSLCFSRDVVTHLLSEEDYAVRYLSPRDTDLAIMFCDISGFTQVSEQVLKEPTLVGKLIDTWSRHAVDIIWSTGGVFDKMVGDCVIGLWGPPFDEMSPREACRHAADAARQIRDFTRRLTDLGELPELRGVEPPLGVATGLSFCRACVGTFGPDEDYTAFGSGVNNTARLQGVAKRGEILCLQSFADAHGGDEFGETLEARVKNVAEPLRYRHLL